MAMRGKTLRRMSPVARKVARLAGEADSLGRRLKNLLTEIQQLEADSRALTTAKGQPVTQVSEPIFDDSFVDIED